MADAAPAEGTLLADRFRLGKRKGAEWRGAIHAATDEQGGAPCEVELVRVSGKQAEQVERIVAREVAIGDWLQDVPDVLRALAWGQLEGGWLYVAREFVADGKPFDPRGGELDERAWNLLSVCQLVSGLTERGIVHRDLGPRALVATPDGKVRLARFALARLDEVAEPWSGPFGLPFVNLLCVAPECFYRPGEADARADVYALGVLLFRALCGKWPYPGPSIPQLIQQQQAARYGQALAARLGFQDESLPSVLDDLCQRAMSLDPADRIATPADLIAELEDWLAVGSEPASASDLGALDLTEPAPPPEPEPEPEPAEPDLENSAVELASEDLTVPEPLDLPDLPTAPEPLPAVEAPAAPEEEPVERVGPTELDGFEVASGGVLLLTVSAPKDLDGFAASFRRLDPAGLSAVLVDLSAVSHLGGSQLEALTELFTLGQRYGLQSGLYGVQRSVKQILRMMELEVHVPPLLEAGVVGDAIAELT